jgi:UDP-glucose 4-epimerase
VGQRILITGISRHLAARLASRLEAEPDVEYIAGVDLQEPELDLERTEYIQADIRNPLLVKTLQGSGVDTVVHLSIITTPTRVGGRSAMKEINVIGSLQLFAACQKTRSVKKLVMKSTAAVYGSSPRDPALFTEDMGLQAEASTGYARDVVEVEQDARDFGRRRRDDRITLLRFANIIGSQIETPLTRYFSLPVVLVALGFDPRIQFVHEDDAVEVLFRAVREEHPGIFNVAADGVLLLSQARRICGKIGLSVPPPLAGPLAFLIRRVGLIDFPADQLRFLVHGRVVDNTRLKREFGFTPALTTREALEEFAAGHRFRRLLTKERADRLEAEVLDLVSKVAGGG